MEVFWSSGLGGVHMYKTLWLVWLIYRSTGIVSLCVAQRCQF